MRTLGRWLNQIVNPAQGKAWRVLLAGFGGLLIVIVVAGIDALVMLRQVRDSNVEIRRAYLVRNRTLEQIRSGIYLSGTTARDYLLAIAPFEAEEQRAKFRAIQADTNAAVASYARSIEPAEAAAFSSLQGEIYTYWRLLELILEANNGKVRTNGSRYFYNQLALKRTSMLALADRISAMNDHELTSGDEKVAVTFDQFRVRQMAIFFISLAGGFALAATTFVYMLRLERQAVVRYEEIVRAQSQLKELSARLVAAQEEERRAISRELHDEVGQSLSALLMEAGAAATLTPPDLDDLKLRLETLKGLAEGSVNLIRNMALLLRPSMLDDLGLVPALRWQAREVAKRTGLKVRMTAEGVPDDLPDEHKTCIFRVVQEALNNCARHAQAQTVRVQVLSKEDRISVSIQDDGIGFDSKLVRGLGQVGMEERVAHVGGRFQIDSEPGRGTLLTAELPLVTQMVNHA